jgi:hypothetical protein
MGRASGSGARPASGSRRTAIADCPQSPLNALRCRRRTQRHDLFLRQLAGKCRHAVAAARDLGANARGGRRELVEARLDPTVRVCRGKV